jgi:hypothetical protein
VIVYLKHPGTAEANFIFRILMTLFNTYKVVIVPKYPSLKTITDPITDGKGYQRDCLITAASYTSIFSALGIKPDTIKAQLLNTIAESK